MTDVVVWEEAFGRADIENYVPMTTRSIFRIASISKVEQILSLLLMYSYLLLRHYVYLLNAA